MNLILRIAYVDQMHFCKIPLPPLALKSTLANLPVSGLFLVTAFASFPQNRRQINLPPFGSDVCSRSATLCFSIFLGVFPEISRHLSAPCG